MMLIGFILSFLLVPILIAILVFLTTLLIFKRRGTRFATTKALTFSGFSAIATLALLFLLLIGGMIYCRRMPREQFDIDRWLDNPESQYAMSHDIVKRRLLIGKSYSEICSMLEERNIIEQDSLQIIYFTGVQLTLLHFVERTMEVYFEKGKVIRVELNATDNNKVYRFLIMRPD